ncbi:antiviral reverse transcriptase Drt3a [Billgrantia aerodenitrificans]|uniref:RNA-directed DNA polymerase n=1 Tax=Billgrantia aerodenitrificans TaxID=2733483 RepID=A0ABS9ATP2_9GAMM|nr:antiviral reverse transcriptase Drt3a [Halomonas aerodenitrificans]MCE8025243.1 RNA-directed DNA polymerase [Halomonas aerodenitrificans]
MQEQSFTAKNFRKIYDSENQKGDYIASGFPSQVAVYSKEIKRWRNIRRRLRKSRDIYSEELYKSRNNLVLKIIRHFDAERSELIDKHLETISSLVTAKRFRLSIEEHNSSHHSKQTYRLKAGLENFFSGKQLQYNIKNTYGVKQAGRDLVVSQLKSILSDNFPKYVIRTDIEDFYENIDRGVLSRKLYENPNLSITSRKMINFILKDYAELSGSAKGIPRGVGVSAYLAELYMNEADEKIKELPGLVYYTRYVDDIVAIFSSAPGVGVERKKEEIAHILMLLGLTLHPTKTKIMESSKVKKFRFDYLGYSFESQGGLKIGISKNKEKRYKLRISSAFEKYAGGSKSSKEKRLLINRIRMLTGNTKLSNNIGGAFVGVYSSNKWVNDASCFHCLDRFMGSKIDALACPSLKRRLRKLSFKDGFESKSFRKFTAKELGVLTKAWKGVV